MGMMNSVDPAQMRRMVENCNRMMEGMMQNMPATPEPDKRADGEQESVSRQLPTQGGRSCKSRNISSAAERC
jgi:hypothetical protein